MSTTILRCCNKKLVYFNIESVYSNTIYGVPNSSSIKMSLFSKYYQTHKGIIMEFVVELSSHIVTQRSAITSMDTEKLNDLMNKIATSGKKMMVVDSLSTYFSVKNMIASIDKSDVENLMLIAEEKGMTISAEESGLIQAFGKLKLELSTRAQSFLPPYEFADIPDNWSIANNLKITRTSIERRVGETGHSIGVKTLSRVWDQASKVWNGDDISKTISSITASGYNRDADIRSNAIKIGCQTIQRFELEQVALHMGWEFPTAIKS